MHVARQSDWRREFCQWVSQRVGTSAPLAVMLCDVNTVVHEKNSQHADVSPRLRGPGIDRAGCADDEAESAQQADRTEL